MIQNKLFYELDRLRKNIVIENNTLLKEGNIFDYVKNCYKLNGLSIAYYKIQIMIEKGEIMLINLNKKR